jgi:SAM-dependent methyltransferase
MTGSQKEIWVRHTAGVTADRLIEMTRSPCQFQAEYAAWFNNLPSPPESNGKLCVCEVGCEFGVTSLLLSSDQYERHCLEFNRDAIKLLEAAAALLGQKVVLHEDDMFHMSIDSGTFDIVFNNGVLEHYVFDERVAALTELRRVLKPGGRIFIGVPNHQSIPYRIAYLLRTAFRRWPYPREYPISDLIEEAAAVGGLQCGRVFLFDKETVFAVFPKPHFTSKVLRSLDRWMNFEAYLKVFEIQRTDISDPVSRLTK